jgi:uncharacterized membrane protein YdfJ with MMPL/SSD domain
MPTTDGASDRATFNLVARMGRWSARHRKLAIVGWLAFVLVALVLGGLVGTKQLSDADTEVGQSRTAAKLFARGGFDSGDAEHVLVQSSTLTAREPAFRSAVRGVERTLAIQPGVDELRSPYATGNGGGISPDGHAALVEFRLGATELGDIHTVGAAVDRVAKQHPQLFIGEYGDATANKANDDSVGKDFHRAELLSIPLTLVILLFAFGAIVAASVPLMLALTAVAAALGLLALPSHFWPADDAANSVILLIGLAVGVDYSLFYIRREREERAAGCSGRAALEAATATSGRAILVSGMTVLVAVAGMFLTGSKSFTAVAVGTMLVVAIAMVGSLTVLPAMLAALGDRIELGRIPLLARLRRRGPGLMSSLVGLALRRPLASVLASVGALLILAAPALALHTNSAEETWLPQGTKIAATYQRIQGAFPGSGNPAYVVASAESVGTPAVRGAFARLKRRALASGVMHGPVEFATSDDDSVAGMSVPLVGSGTDQPSERALNLLRHKLVPETLGRVAGTETAVGGLTASSKDFNDALKRHLPIVFAFVLGFAFLLLLSAFRSLVVAAKAIALNLLSVAAAYGLLVAVFQWGWGESLLDFHSTGGIVAWLPLFLFVVLFGLSMDYHVFLLSRVREAVDRGLDTDAAVSDGIRRTAGVVTSAAVVMVAVFAIFATLSRIDLKELGVGLAAAIFIDATLVRAVLLPATMKLLGDWNWYLPTWLEWLPQLGHEETPEALPAGATS